MHYIYSHSNHQCPYLALVRNFTKYENKEAAGLAEENAHRFSVIIKLNKYLTILSCDLTVTNAYNE